MFAVKLEFYSKMFIKTTTINGNQIRNTNNGNQHVSSTVSETKESGYRSKPKKNIFYGNENETSFLSWNFTDGIRISISL